MNLSPNENDYLVFIDETGDKVMKDPKHPLYGFCFVGMLAKDLNYIESKWMEMKTKLRKKAFHSVKVRFSPAQVNHIGNFFNKCNEQITKIIYISDIATNFETPECLESLERVIFKLSEDKILKKTTESIYLLYEANSRLQNAYQSTNFNFERVSPHYICKGYFGVEICDLILYIESLVVKGAATDDHLAIRNKYKSSNLDNFFYMKIGDISIKS